jgi:glycosyltransferase involved in cell wall biosynthesis
MKIALIAHGIVPIPPKDWGAVEGTLWHRKLFLEQLGHTVDIYNSPKIHDTIHKINQASYDFVHCHNELFVLALTTHLKRPFAVTSHFGGLHQFAAGGAHPYPAFEYLFQDTLQAAANIVLSERIRDLYQRRGYPGFLRVLRNAVETSEFRFAGAGNGKAVCVGLLSARKRQAWLAEATRKRVEIDFVGPRSAQGEPVFRENETAKYLGVWDKPTLYARLTDYSCLVLLSESEGAPKVVLEALAAGLSVVVTEACAANLTEQDFISLIPDGETRSEVVCEAIQRAIDRNRALRGAAREYALGRFDYSVVVQDYLRIIGEFRQLNGDGPG